MKNPVLPLNNYIDFLKNQIEQVANNIATGPSPEDLKQKSLEAIGGNKGKRVVALKEAMDIITEQAYYKGQMDILNHLSNLAEQILKQYEDSVNGNE